MEREYEMNFAQFVRDRRKQMNLTQEGLADLVHVSKSAVTKWESGRGLPDRTNLRQLAKVIGVSVEILNGICEGNELSESDGVLIAEIIALLEKHGYKVTKR